MSTPRRFDDLTFSLYANADETLMYEQWYRDGAWQPGQIVPYHDIPLSPAAGILNYGQGIFEGIKAFRTEDDRVVMFRPRSNAERFARSCSMLSIPAVQPRVFFDAVTDLVRANAEFVPTTTDGSRALYLRPVCIATEPMLGVRAAHEYLFYVFVSPVGPYFSGMGRVRLIVTDRHRASARGTGAAKAVCNYAGTMPPRAAAKAAGYDEALFLDARSDRWIEEAGAANFFALMDDGTLVTPGLGSILPGITRESIIRIASELLGVTVEERPLSIEEVCEHATECFLSGTGATITSVTEIGWRGRDYDVNQGNCALAGRLYDTLLGIQLQRRPDPFGWVFEL